MQPFGHNTWAKIGGVLCTHIDRKLGVYSFFGEEELGPHLKHWGRAEAYLHAKFILELSNRLATIQQRCKQAGQTDNGLIA